MPVSGSVLVNLTSVTATRRSDKYENGNFQCILNNTNRIDKATSVYPHRIYMPNMFGNVKENHTFRVVDPSTGGTYYSFTIRENFYDPEDYVTEWTAAYAYGKSVAPQGHLLPTITMSFNASQSVYIQLAVSAVGSYACYIVASEETWENVGFDPYLKERGSFPLPETYVHTKGNRFLTIVDGFVLNGYINSSTPLVNPTNKPNFAGEQFVYVMIKQSCQGNLISSDSSQYNVLACVDLSKTDYGKYACEKSVDPVLDEVVLSDIRSLQIADIEIVDKNFHALKVPRNHDVTILLKVFHKY